jgi:hypothetical protein
MGKPSATTCNAGYTRVKASISVSTATPAVTTYTAATCKSNSSGIYLAVSYIALAAMMMLALF